MSEIGLIFLIVFIFIFIIYCYRYHCLISYIKNNFIAEQSRIELFKQLNMIIFTNPLSFMYFLTGDMLMGTIFKVAFTDVLTGKESLDTRVFKKYIVDNACHTAKQKYGSAFTAARMVRKTICDLDENKKIPFVLRYYNNQTIPMEHSEYVKINLLKQIDNDETDGNKPDVIENIKHQINNLSLLDLTLFCMDRQ